MFSADIQGYYLVWPECINSTILSKPNDERPSQSPGILSQICTKKEKKQDNGASDK